MGMMRQAGQAFAGIAFAGFTFGGFTFGVGVGPAASQGITVPAPSDRIESSGSAIIRGLDRVAGTNVDIVLSVGAPALIGHLRVTLGDCRYPVENPAGEAYAWIEVRDTRADDTLIFAGWMVASSPALNALDHRRYDLWVLRCSTS